MVQQILEASYLKKEWTEAYVKSIFKKWETIEALVYYPLMGILYRKVLNDKLVEQLNRQRSSRCYIYKLQKLTEKKHLITEHFTQP